MRYDVIIIGAGAAGIAAAIQLARYNHSVLVFDGGDGRTSWVPAFHNYLGFPQGVSGKELLRQGKEQAQKYGAEIVKSKVNSVRIEDQESFSITTSSAEYRCRRLILATGIEDVQPDISNKYDFAGRSLFYCLDCNSYEFIGKKAVVLGHEKNAAASAISLLPLTNHVNILTNGKPISDFENYQDKLKEYRITVIDDPIDKIIGEKSHGQMTGFRLVNGQTIPAEAALSTYGTRINNELAKSLGVETLDNGHVIVNDRMETNVPYVYAAGDIANHTQMLVIGVAGGIRAGIFVHRSL